MPPINGKYLAMIVMSVCGLILLSRFLEGLGAENELYATEHCPEMLWKKGLDEGVREYIGKTLYFVPVTGWGWDNEKARASARPYEAFTLDTLWHDKESLRGGGGTFLDTQAFGGRARILFDTRHVARYDFDKCVGDYNISIGSGTFVYDDTARWLHFRGLARMNGFGIIRAKRPKVEIGPEPAAPGPSAR